jgi:hypothetical protein
MRQQQEPPVQSSKTSSSTSILPPPASAAAAAPSAVQRDASDEHVAFLGSSLALLEPRSVTLELQPQHMLGIAVQGACASGVFAHAFCAVAG